ncbi:MAG TPA: hypothetical protein VNL16_16730, partial [Chloroflexota bacterium]|nr:hypothetical protein [Chloroflexota bacterium]
RQNRPRLPSPVRSEIRTMISRFRRLLTDRLPHRLICRFPLIARYDATHGLARELVLVVSPTAPHLRRLTVYRRHAIAPTEPPRAA